MSKGKTAMHSDTKKVVDKWGQFARQRRVDPRFSRIFAMDHPLVREYVYNTYLGGMDPFSYLRTKLSHVPCRRGLEVACGSGDLSIAVVKTGLCQQVEASDLSPDAIDVARHSAQAAGLDTINFQVADANTIALPKNHYDLIYISQSLHHVEQLEHLYEQIHGALTDDGVFFVSDYVGPTRMQWTDKQLEITNAILTLLPSDYRRLLNQQGQIRNVVERTKIADFLRIDPSEGVRASEIVPLARKFFDVFDFRPMGCSIIYELLLEIVHNFDDDSEVDLALLRLICLLEKFLVEAGVVASDFACFAARKRQPVKRMVET